MKKVVYAMLSVLFLAFSSCSEDKAPIAPKSETTVSTVANEIVTPQTPLPFITRFDLSRANVGVSDTKGLANGRIATWTEFGPYTLTPPLTKILTDHKVFISNTKIPSLATGNYFCDIYRCVSTVTIPTGALMMYQGSSKTGYSNYSTQDVGVSITQVGQTYTFSTFSMIVKYNSIGQTINAGPFPVDLTGTTFNLKYLQDI
jgi:hypothetical protein